MIRTKLQDLNFLNNNVVLEKHNVALAKISKLDGSLKYCLFANIFNYLVTMIENKNNNAIENINTNYNTILNIYANLSLEKKNIDKTQEVEGILQALEFGIKKIATDGFINKTTFTRIQQIIRNNDDEIRAGFGINITDSNGNIIWVPPQSKDEILKYLDELEVFINNDNKYPLIKMAIIHYQFEAIHPYNDGNGRTGRIINILYLIMCNVISSPFIPISQQIEKTKKKYYELFQAVNKNEKLIDEFIIYILDIISIAMDESTKILDELNTLFININQNPKIEKSLVDLLYKELIISVKLICKNMNVTPYLAKKLLNTLISENLIVQLDGSKKEKFYILTGIAEIINRL